MKNLSLPTPTPSIRTRLLVAAFALANGVLPAISAASTYNGGGINDGVNEAANQLNIPTTPAREAIRNVILTAVSYVGLAAVVVIVVAGIYLVVSAGSDDARDRAKKIILYTAIGMIIIALSGAFVMLLTTIAGPSK